jgi:hypothetical protein
MWKPLAHTYKANIGDKVRFADSNSFVSKEVTYEVVKTERHYFEISPSSHQRAIQLNRMKRVIRYFDLGYNIGLEIWISTEIQVMSVDQGCLPATV